MVNWPGLMSTTLMVISGVYMIYSYFAIRLHLGKNYPEGKQSPVMGKNKYMTFTGGVIPSVGFLTKEGKKVYQEDKRFRALFDRNLAAQILFVAGFVLLVLFYSLIQKPAYLN